MRKQALWLGRFQPPTIAHLATLQEILRFWEKVVVGVIVRSSGNVPPDSPWKQFLDSTASQAVATWKNPFTGDEIVRLWMDSIVGEVSSGRVIFVTMPQVAHQLDFSSRFPKETYDFVEVEYGSDSTESDRLRLQTFASLLERSIHFVQSPLILHNTEIRHLVSSGKSWTEFIPQGALETFTELNGASRLKI